MPTAVSLPDDWPAHPDRSLSLNRMGSFDWDLVTGLMHMDTAALEVFDTAPEEYDGRPESLAPRVPPTESVRLDALVSSALKSGVDSYGAYFRIRCHDGELRWTHTQGRVMRGPDGRPYRIIGIVRDATEELSHSAERLGLDEERRRQTSVVESTTAALAHARTVQDVIDALGDAHGLERLGSMGMVMGLVEAGRIHLVAEGPAGSFVPGTRYTRIDEQYPMSEVVRSLQPRFLDSAAEFAAGYPGLWAKISSMHISAAAYLPLIAQARPIGAIGLLYRDKAGFTQEERNLLVALGSSIAQSLQRAMLLEQEHDLAEGLQQAMLPRRIPSVPGAEIAVRYRSARMGRDIGGDWYDVVPLGEGRVGVMIGDVEGHDTDAAAVMGQLRIALRAYIAEGHAPGAAMERASAFLRDLETERFATCTYVDIDLTSGMALLVRAGHLDPVVRRGDGSCHRVQVAGGLPLGLPVREPGAPGTGARGGPGAFGTDGTGYPVTSLELHPGDTLLLCTDGLTERPGGDPDTGVRELMDAVRDGPADVEELADVLCDLVGDSGGGDDMALLLLRRRGTPLPRGGGPLRHRLTPGDPDAPAMARHLIRAASAAWGAWDQADEIELAADELMTNALVHTDGVAGVSMRLTPEGRIRIEVEDTSSALPRRREADDWAVSGRGLMLVDRLADAWGVEPRGGGKCVWCEFAVQAPADSGPAEPTSAHAIAAEPTPDGSAPGPPAPGPPGPTLPSPQPGAM
ncbi:SpoIIE family protein phosphatase [Streptomyces sp. NPDC006450]|uniref:SpoIIE family protein phosphatase n=1 Tax=Streptomyces sp. NPDC006450 TaxID=3155458 RepID=UPI0033AFE157